MDEKELIKSTMESYNSNDTAQGHSITIKKIGHVKKICKANKWSTNACVNIAIDILCTALCPSGVRSDAYMEITKKANELDDEEVELHLIRVAVEIMGGILRQAKEGDSLHQKIVEIIKQLKEGGVKLTISECVLAILAKALQDRKFVEEFLDNHS